MFTYGFYNSKDGDRVYDAIQISSIFDGIIRDGVFMSIGDHLNVTASNRMTISVGTGRAWFNHSWNLNDSPLLLMVPPSEIVMKRIDAVVLEVGNEPRINEIKIIKGTPSNTPQKPALINNNTKHQYVLAYINVGENVSEIRQANIENMIGTSGTPFVTGILETINIDSLIAQWGAQWNDWSSDITKEYIEWAKQLHDILDGETAGNLAFRILELERKDSSTEQKIAQNTTKININTSNIAALSNEIGDLETRLTDIRQLINTKENEYNEKFVQSSEIRTIRYVTSLPSDAATHPEILYLIPNS